MKDGEPKRYWRGQRSMEVASEADLRTTQSDADDWDTRGLRPIDLVPCKVCSLRGHEAMDPDKCLQPVNLGLGGWQFRGEE